MTVREFKVAQALTSRPVKGMLTGPVTILNWSFPRLDVTRKEQVRPVDCVAMTKHWTTQVSLRWPHLMVQQVSFVLAVLRSSPR